MPEAPDNQALADLAKLVRSRRETMGLSRADLATRCGLSASTIKNIEAGRHVPVITTLRLLEKTLECELTGSAEPSPLSALVMDMLNLLLQRVSLTLLVDAVVAAKMDRQKLAVALLQRGDHA